MGAPTQIAGLRLTALASALLTAGALVLGTDSAAAQSACQGDAGLYSYNSVEQMPSACWRPYSPSSPFNLKIRKNARTEAGSRAIVKSLRGEPISKLGVGDRDIDGGNPIFFPDPADPEYTIHCTRDWGRCDIEEMKIRIPAAAQPAGGLATPDNDHDAHMTVVDAASGWEYDLWHVESKPATGGTIEIGWGGRTRIDGDGLGSGGTAARYGNLAGLIRSTELASGQINHALAMVVPCTNAYVYPAQWFDLSCAEAGLPAANAPAMGARFQLDISKRELKRLKLPDWKRAIVKALRTYGAYVSDTTGDPTQWGFEVESGATYTSFGLADPTVELAQRARVPAGDWNGNGETEYWFDLAPGVPWSKLRVIASS